MIRVVERHRAGETGVPRPVVGEHNYDAVADLVAAKVKSTDGRITAKRLLPLARAEGYGGSDQNFRRLVAATKVEWRRTGRHAGSSWPSTSAPWGPAGVLRGAGVITGPVRRQ